MHQFLNCRSFCSLSPKSRELGIGSLRVTCKPKAMLPCLNDVRTECTHLNQSFIDEKAIDSIFK